ncbi:uncharacterized protein LOC111334066 [Stylophora pistillata]|uniref:Uncharacterized protein n=1 Tax=Stylophora pistillata TaxID=50429 RepID=A0A2B4S0L1_STYPI|nr:uncharacterized protein LOC111334066 [Stylophora pistillata]PFX22583.1 hypothetical protein AWC38_SpisGene12897 [Stylophora pistillata]
MKFPLLISSLFVLSVIPRMDSKPGKLVPLNEEGSVLAQDEFWSPRPLGKRSANINYNTVDDQDELSLLISKRSADINFNTGDDYDKGTPTGKRSAGIIFNTDDDYDRTPPGVSQLKRGAGINFNTGDEYDRVPPPQGKRSAGINFKTVED